MTIRAVLFDLDNTLTHRDQSVVVYAKQFLHDFSGDLADQDLEKMLQIVCYIDNGGYPKKERLTHPSIAASVGQALLQELNWSQPPDLSELTEYWFQQFGLAAVAMPEAETLLQQLKQQDFKLAVISNGGHATRLKILEGLGFIDYFDEIISSELVGISKPKPEFL